MNQILYVKKAKSKLIFLIKIQLIVSSLLLVYYIYKYYYYQYNINKYQKLSNLIVKNYNTFSLYESKTSDTIVNFDEENITYVMGTISIEKLAIKYPILSDISDTLLKIAPCKLYGPTLNTTGNLCIAAHNYNNGTFFSNLDKLDIFDIIKISDSSRKFSLLLCI